MNVDAQRTLIAWAKLQLRIARAKAPDAHPDISEDRIADSAGYQFLRRWFLGLSSRAQRAALLTLRMQVNGVRQVLDRARAAGVAPDLADLEMTLRDATTGEEIAAPVEIRAAPACPGSGERGERVMISGVELTRCRMCSGVWPDMPRADKIPTHEPTI